MITRRRHTATVHEVGGSKIADIPAEHITQTQWNREGNQVSRAMLTCSAVATAELADEVRPWVHWVTIWDKYEPVWTGPILSSKSNSSTLTLTCRDVATFAWRTRVPTSRTWNSTDPAVIAADLWVDMLDLHRVQTKPAIYPDPLIGRFDFTVSADQRMLNQTFDDLTKLGLEWVVHKGTPILGPFTKRPTVYLDDRDFLVDFEVVRDGSSLYTDVRVQGQNFAQSEVVDVAGLRLQTLISLDDLYGVANIQTATRQYAKKSSRFSDQLVVPSNASLHPEAPVDLDDLVPGNLFVVTARGLTNLMRVTSMQVTDSTSGYDVAVSLTAVADTTELEKVTGSIGGAL